MANQLTPDQIADFKEAFSLFDKEGKGSITAKDLETVLKQFGINPSLTELDDMIKEQDVDGNGRVDFQEFLEAMARKQEAEAGLLESFQLADKDGNGLISKAEMKEFIVGQGQPLTDEEVNELFEQGDVDGDGYINFQEFV